jgi:hypothetical protein
MNIKPPMTVDQAQQFLVAHDLGFLDVCSMVVAYAAATRGMIKFTDDRCVVHIKSTRRKRAENP